MAGFATRNICPDRDGFAMRCPVSGKSGGRPRSADLSFPHPYLVAIVRCPARQRWYARPRRPLTSRMGSATRPGRTAVRTAWRSARAYSKMPSSIPRSTTGQDFHIGAWPCACGKWPVRGSFSAPSSWRAV